MTGTMSLRWLRPDRRSPPDRFNAASQTAPGSDGEAAPERQHSLPGPAILKRRVDRAAIGLTALASAAYLWIALSVASKPYWMDEVLAVWTARRDGVHGVWDALRQGAEFSPPLYHLMLQAILAAGFDNPVLLRLPSILAIYVVALAAFVLVRRRFALPVACLALVFCLSGPLFSYAVQARQYACVAACFALACTLWDGRAERTVSGIRALGIAVLLSLAIGMHFYAILLAAALGLMELGWMLRHRRVRWPIVLALLMAAASLLLWLPIMQAVSAYNLGDAAAPDYYARPTVERLFATYAVMLGGNGMLPPTPLAILLAGFCARVVARRRASARAEDFGILAAVLCMVPLLIFAFSALVTGTFNPRYVIVTAIGVSLIVAQCVAANRHGDVIACGMIAASIAAFQIGGETAQPTRREMAIDLVNHAPEGLPIATGNGLRFFETYEGADRAVARRLSFLKVPDLSRSPDPTNDHQVERWVNINAELPVVSIDRFLASNTEFLLFEEPKQPDMVPDYLRARGYVVTPIVERASMSLTLVRRVVPNTGSQ